MIIFLDLGGWGIFCFWGYIQYSSCDFAVLGVLVGYTVTSEIIYPYSAHFKLDYVYLSSSIHMCPCHIP